MNLRRFLVLLIKDFIHGSKSFLFIWILVAPLVITLIFSLAFGTLFREKPRLGVLDTGKSSFVEIAKKSEAISLNEYSNLLDVRRAVERGAVDFGLVLPENFDDALKSGEKVSLEMFIYGQSLAKHRIILGVTITSIARQISGVEAPLSIQTITLGETENIPWEDRILPALVMIAIFMSGIFLPATSILEEKNRGTIQAVIVTPVTPTEVILTKGALGVLISVTMGIIILLLNSAWTNQYLLILSMLFLGAVMASTISLILGVLVKDLSTLFSIWKSGAIILFLPALTYLFPQIPAWIGKIVPTYYLITPIINIVQKGAGWPQVWLDMLICAGVNTILIILLIAVVRLKKPFSA